MAQTTERITLAQRARSAFLRQPPPGTPESAVRKAYDSRRSARSLLASALPIEGSAGKQAWRARSGDDAWQKQAWYYYDAVGELRFAFNWLANAISRATLYAAEMDPETGMIGEPTDDARAQAAAEQVLGGADDRPQLQSTLALQWQVGGETFILIQPQAGAEPDRWMALSSSSVRQQGGSWSFKDPLTGVWTKMREGVDRLIRIWSPHPDDQTHSDSAMRAAIPILTEIERSSQNIVARLESRLAGNGVMFIPQEISFPGQDGEQAGDAASTLMGMLLEAAEIGIREPGTAAAQVPIMAEVPSEFLAALASAHIDLSTELDGQVTELRESALTRLGRTLDMPRELAMGELASANHWSGWLIEESTYKIHVEPFLLKLGMALTKTYYRPALAAMGVADPERFVLAWDITEVVARPDDKEDVKYLLENNLISDNWARSKFGVPDDAIPTEEEAKRNLARVLVSGAPTLLENPDVAATLGFEPTPAAGSAPSGTADSIGTEPASNVRALPTTRDAAPDPQEGLVAAAELVVFDALSRAGGRLLTRQYRGQFAATPKWELHTVIPLGGRTEIELLEGSFQFVPNIAHAFGLDADQLAGTLMSYVGHRIRGAQAHDREALRRVLVAP